MTTVTEINNQVLTLTEDRLGNWIIKDDDGNELFLQSNYDQDDWSENLIIQRQNGTWTVVRNWLIDNDFISDIDYIVRTDKLTWHVSLDD